MNILTINYVSKRFGGIWATADVKLNFKKGEIVGIIGPNGSGKTTLLNIINGFYTPDKGSIIFDGKRIEGQPPNKLAKMGMGRTFQVPKLFTKMTVIENMLVPAFSSAGMRKSSEIVAKAEEILKLIGLYRLKDNPANALSGGQQKLLEFGRAMMADPRIMLLDEPFAAVHPLMKGRIIELIEELNKRRDVTFLIVSHEIPSVTKICKRLIVMNNGRVIADGQPKEITASTQVIEAYLGETHVTKG